ncbi:NAD-dependent epimerase/dehydratase family protein [Methylobacterium terricola]|uniref:NAD-dependent epimerase/dehydratase family protein n=1 Tax=Methylobacterium terricola TaxID=2583531 RepID=A0A5C4LCF0_9HYPH|nr:NAD-dependent epimerase/dehydratase family protein [Methylobacterium terricola]TNC10236.1 NAD-dependent epimerase/dehydratase family protein [Methylobacterium terricola]
MLKPCEPSLVTSCRELGRVLVTGGAGFVGSHIVDQLVARGCREIVVVDNLVRGRTENLSGALAAGAVELVIGDIRDRDLMAGLVAGCDTVFHQAALRITHCAAEPREAIEVMVDATATLAELCVAEGVGKLVYASSASVYGMATTFPTPEAESHSGNRTLYGAAKSFGEGLLRSWNDMAGLDYVALRYFNVYGPRMDLHGRYTEVLIRWMERIARGEAPLIFGDGLQTMDFVDVRDVARANILAALSPASDVALNVGRGEETSLLGLAQRLAAIMDRPDLVPVHEAERSVNPVPRRLADVSLARDLTGFEAQIGLDEGLDALVAWWRATSKPVAEAPAKSPAPVMELAS